MIRIMEDSFCLHPENRTAGQGHLNHRANGYALLPFILQKMPQRMLRTVGGFGDPENSAQI